MSKSDIWQTLDWIFLVPSVIFCNMKYLRFFSESFTLYLGLVSCCFFRLKHSYELERRPLFLHPQAFAVMDVCFYSSAICLEICNHMGLHLFKIPYKAD